jgi:hypothetical protein
VSSQPLRPKFDPRSGYMGFVDGSDTEAGFLRVLRFPLPILIPPAASYPLMSPFSTLHSLYTDGLVGESKRNCKISHSGQCLRPRCGCSTFLIIVRSVGRDNAVGIATGYGLDYRGVGVRVPVVSRIFSSPRHPHRL